jgi:hypothetical protein
MTARAVPPVGPLVVDEPGNKRGFRIAEVFVYASVDRDGDEGVIAMATPGGGWLPAIMADRERLKSLKPYADQMRRQGHKIRLVRLSVREELTDEQEAELTK